MNPQAQTPALSPLATPERPERPKRHWRHRLGRGLDALSVYLPLLLMAVLALASYWLIRATPLAEENTDPTPERQEPDYFMRGFSIQVFEPDGRLRGEIAGQELRHLPPQQGFEVDQARVHSRSAQGTLITASAQRVRSNQAQTEFSLQGQARVTRQAPEPTPALHISGEHLQISAEPQRIWSEQPVRIERGKDIITADRLNHSTEPSLLTLEGRVRATLVPRPAP